MEKLLSVMCGGCLGAAGRYGVNLLATRFWGSGFPWGTLIVNMVGCFLVGLVFGLAERMAWLTPSVRLFFVTGLLGALTTFSSFAVETVSVADAGFPFLAGINFLANNAGGLALVLVGLWLAKVL